MLLKLVLASTFSLSVLADNVDMHRIANGSIADKMEFPFAISLWRNGHYVCGGTILNQDFILTSAHCACITFGGPSVKYKVQYGLSNTAENTHPKINVKRIYCHAYNSRLGVSDVAVLQLAESLPGNGQWQPAIMSGGYASSFRSKGVIIGWGETAHNKSITYNLRKYNVIVYDDDFCRKKNFTIDYDICLGSQTGSACSGISGGPLLVNGIQIGIASFITKIGCENAAPGEVTVAYVRVPRYLHWIKSVAGYVPKY